MGNEIDTISNLSTDKTDVKNQLGSLPQVTPALRRFTSQVGVRHLATKLSSRTAEDSFVIGKSIIGTDELGDRSLEGAVYVLLPDNQFEEYWTLDEFIDTDTSTATWTSGQVELADGGEFVQSAIVSHNPGITFLTVTIVEGLQDDALDLYLSNDDGATWNLAETGTSLLTFPSAGNGKFKYKIVNDSSEGTKTITERLILKYGN